MEDQKDGRVRSDLLRRLQDHLLRRVSRRRTAARSARAQREAGVGAQQTWTTTTSPTQPPCPCGHWRRPTDLGRGGRDRRDRDVNAVNGLRQQTAAIGETTTTHLSPDREHHTDAGRRRFRVHCLSAS